MIDLLPFGEILTYFLMEERFSGGLESGQVVWCLITLSALSSECFSDIIVNALERSLR